jgi:hypothetical protein
MREPDGIFLFGLKVRLWSVFSEAVERHEAPVLGFGPRARCQENGIEHRLTKFKHPWTNGQVERMNRTIKEAERSRANIALEGRIDCGRHNLIDSRGALGQTVLRPLFATKIIRFAWDFSSI